MLTLKTTWKRHLFLRELKVGTPVYDDKNNKVGYSKAAAQQGIGQVILSRICMAVPGMSKFLIEV